MHRGRDILPARARIGAIAACLLHAPLWVHAAEPPAEPGPAPAPARPALTEADISRARLLGVLLYTNVSVDFDRTAAREAVEKLQAQCATPLVARWRDDEVGFGLEPSTPVSILAENRPLLDVLEELLEQCSRVEGCTWQLRRGFVELGSKERLSVPAAREARLYDIRDLMIEPTRFGEGRKSPLALAVEVVEEVCETIEPGRWDYGQEPELPRAPDDDDDARLPTVVPAIEGGGPASAPSQPAPAQPAPAQPAPPGPQTQPAAGSTAGAKAPRSRTQATYWAAIRVWRDQLIVVAPDFIHRQVGGYPDPIMPAGAPSDRAPRRWPGMAVRPDQEQPAPEQQTQQEPRP